MITTKQRAKLRSIASTYEPIMQIGKEALKEQSITQIEEMLQARELVKIKVLRNCEEQPKDIATKVQNLINCEVVQVIGSIFVLYKKSTKKGIKHIDFN